MGQVRLLQQHQHAARPPCAAAPRANVLRCAPTAPAQAISGGLTQRDVDDVIRSCKGACE